MTKLPFGTDTAVISVSDLNARSYGFNSLRILERYSFDGKVFSSNPNCYYLFSKITTNL